MRTIELLLGGIIVVTNGNNLYYSATPGWDYTTGLGTPKLANFDQAVSSTLAQTASG
jgi:kumamolisin